MDKVLTRKLFKDRYLQTVSKNIVRFKKGGLASLKAEHYQKGGGVNIEDPYAGTSLEMNFNSIKPVYVSKEDYTKDTLDLSQPTSTITKQEPTVITPTISKSSPSIIPAPTNPVKQAIKESPDLGTVYSEGERKAMLLAPIASALLTGTRMPGQSQLGAVASNVGAALPKVVDTSIQIKKLENERLSELAKLQKAANESAYDYMYTLTEKDLADRGLPKGTFAQEKIKVLADGTKVRTNDITIKEKPSAEEIQKQADKDQALSQLKDISISFTQLKNEVGPIVGNIKSYLTQTPIGDKKFAEFESNIELYNKNFIKATRGAQVGPLEVKELKPVLLSVTDSPDVMAAKIKVHDQYLGSLNERVNSYKGNLIENKYLPQKEFKKDIDELKTNIYGAGSVEKLPSGVVKIRAKNLG